MALTATRHERASQILRTAAARRFSYGGAAGLRPRHADCCFWLVVAVRSLDELIAWQLADAFKVEVYGLLRRSPGAARDRAFADQLRAAAASAAMNIGEGFYRYRPRDFARFLAIALASLGEATLWLRDGIQREHFDVSDCEPAFLLARRCRIASSRILPVVSER